MDAYEISIKGDGRVGRSLFCYFISCDIVRRHTAIDFDLSINHNKYANITDTFGFIHGRQRRCNIFVRLFFNSAKMIFVVQ